IAIPWVTSNSPCPEPWWPQVVMNLPSREYLTMRSLVLSPWPSAMKMSPFGATTTSDGPLSSLSPLPATPGLPIVIITRPAGVNFIAVSPRPLPAWPSVTQTLPSLSVPRPCGQLISCEPKLTTCRPVESNFWIGAMLEPTQVLPPQRSNTQRLEPSRSMSTPIACPHIRPSGSFAQCSTTLYGFGALLGSSA